MILSFALSLLSVFGPVLFIARSVDAKFLFLQWSSTALFAVGLQGYSVAVRLILSVIGASAVTYLVIANGGAMKQSEQVRSGSETASLGDAVCRGPKGPRNDGVIALLCILDGFLIFSRMSWGDGLTGSPFLRPPFSLDFERNLVLIGAILRNGMSPFLPASELSYQTLWHSWASLFVGLKSKIPNFHWVAGCTLASAYLFFFTLIQILRKHLPNQKLLLAALLALAATHAELYNLLASLWKGGPLGFEMDWSTPFPIYFRAMSFKLLAMIAPQHLLFFWAFLIFLNLEGKNQVWRGLLATVAFLASPILFAICFFPWLLWNFSKPHLIQLSLSLLAGGTLAVLLFHQNPLMYFSQGRSDGIWMFPLHFIPYLPLLFVLTSGTLGLLVSLSPVKKKGTGYYWLLAIGLGITANFIFSNAELRRHVSMVLFALLWMLAVIYARPRLTLFAAALSLLFHGYFLYAYLGKPSALNPEIAYEDYFRMNRVIAEKYPKLPVLAAFGLEAGIDLPIPLHATTSFVIPLTVTVHGKVNERQRTLLQEAERQGHVLPVARALGYEAILWGPIEEKLWPAWIKTKFADESQNLATTGSVSLYRLK